jgi:hypothetical protein
MASIFVTHQGEGDFAPPGYPFPFPSGEAVELTDAFAAAYFRTRPATLGARLERYNVNRETPRLVISDTDPAAPAPKGKTGNPAPPPSDTSDTTAGAPPQE